MQDKRPGSPATELELLKSSDDEQNGKRDEQIRRQRFDSKMKLFILNLAMLNTARCTFRMYLVGTIRTIERRFGLRSATTSYIISMEEVAHVALVLFLGHFGRKGHKPLMIGVTAMFPAIAGLFMAAPYFILPSSSLQEYSRGNLSSPQFDMGPHTAQMCNDTIKDQGCDRGMDRGTQNAIAVGFFVVGSLLAGVGGPATFTLGFPYIYENAKPSLAGIGLGFVSSSFSLGPVLGLLLASGCTRLPENLTGTDMKPTDPNFIGAWWLGFGLEGLAVLMLGAPMFFYPRPMTSKRGRENQKATTRKHWGSVIWNKLKSMFRNVGRLLRLKAYLALTISDVFGTFFIVGVLQIVPRYMEIYFLMPAYQANMSVAVSAPVMSMVGGLLGGAMLSKVKPKLVGIAKLLLVGSGLILVVSCLLLFIRCPKLKLDREFDMEMKEFSITTTCNRNCSCLANKKTYMPVCGSDDLTYFSPCHAGCAASNVNGSFSDCSCTESGTARAGFCLETCPLYLPFTVGLAVIGLLLGAGKCFYAMGLLRAVPENEKTLALGIASFARNVFAYLPAPIFFGHVIDTACDLWQNICGESGNCLFFDPDKFRWRTYGSGLVFFFVNFLLVALFFYLAKQKKSDFGTTGERNGEKKSTGEVE